MHEATKTDPRERVIAELMLDDAALSRADAEKLYDDAAAREAELAPFGRHLEFGLGNLALSKGTYCDRPALFVARSIVRGKVGELVETSMPSDRLVTDEFVMTFPTTEQANLVADAICNRRAATSNEAHFDDLAVDRFAGFMKRKLAAKRAQGRAGWHDPEQCTVAELSEMLIEHVEKGDPLDVALFAMMIHHRGGRIEAHDDDVTRCVACDEIIEKGDLVYIEKGEGGFIHAECAGTDREGFVDDDDNPLQPGDPIPDPFPFSSKASEAGQ